MNPADPNELQRTAAAPDASAWVAASAGSGKTKVLSDRVLNLLLNGTPPEKILCLTFTRTAAAEMANRVTEILSKWATAEDDVLERDLESLSGKAPKPSEKEKARCLFARLLDAPGGINIMTIHGFCQSLLKRFPLEAGVSPQFDVLDEQGTLELMEQAEEETLADPAFAKDLDLIALMTDDKGFSDLLKELSFFKNDLEALLSRCPTRDALKSEYERVLGLPNDATQESLIAEFCRPDDKRKADLKKAAEILIAGKSVSVRENGEIIKSFVNADENKRIESCFDYLTCFLTKDLTSIRKRLTNKDSAAAQEIMQNEAERALKLHNDLNAETVLRGSLALSGIGMQIIKRYDELKKERSVADYDDLISAARRLLEKSGAAAWVLFKLDGGIEHILVDEAQDTSPEQWAVVKALAEEFFSGEGASKAKRTVFAVGDKKQSIYSFQGADPDEFERMRAFFRQKATNARQAWHDVPMYISFRSTPAVIEAVNRTLKNPVAARGVVDEGEDATHLSWRKGEAGLVEIWPTEKTKTDDTPQMYTKPVEQIVVKNASSRLAGKIAKKIADMIKAKEFLPSVNRPIQAGDVLVLVRRRNSFVEELSRELKAADVPVSGVDRLKITSHIAVQDLMALGDFLLLPEDDLALATVLRSPLCNVSEDDLFHLACGRRPQSLLTRLARHKNETDTDLGKAYAFLSDLLNCCDKMPPFELYSYVLGACQKKKAFLSRLGMQAADALDEFLTLALNRDKADTPSLQNFLKYLRQNEIEIKRDPDQKNFDAVRIMTVHASKGLQAPVVFLPDTRRYKKHTSRLLRLNGTKLPVWVPKKDFHCEDTLKTQTTLQEKELDEYRRLLYVAMTRAADRLYLCGWDGKMNPPDGNWYDLIRSSLILDDSGNNPVYAGNVKEINDPMFDEPVLRLESERSIALNRDVPALSEENGEEMPECLLRPAPEEPEPPRPLTPSKPEIEEPSFLSPLSPERQKAAKRGLMIHTLLETLPYIKDCDRFDAALRLMQKRMPETTEEERSKIVSDVLNILNSNDFKFLFSETSLSEVPVSGVVKNKVINGRIDRLAITKDQVLIADYKSNRRIPQSAEEIPEAYIAQAKAYAQVLEKIYPDKKIRSFLIWTEEAKLWEITDLL